MFISVSFEVTQFAVQTAISVFYYGNKQKYPTREQAMERVVDIFHNHGKWFKSTGWITNYMLEDAENGPHILNHAKTIFPELYKASTNESHK